MPTDKQLDETISRWLEAEAPSQLPDRVLRATFERTRRTRQQVGWRALLGRLQVNRFMIPLGGAAIVAVVAALALGIYVNNPRSGVGSQTTPPASPASPSPVTQPPSLFTERFDSPTHGLSIGYPSGWQTRPATEPWTEGELNFDSPAADVIFDPTLGDRLYLVLASQPLSHGSEDAWRDEKVAWLCTGNGAGMGWPTVDGADAFVITCGSTQSAALIFTDTRGYLIRLVVSSDEPGLAETHDGDWHKAMLETVDLRPEEALDALSPSESP